MKCLTVNQIYLFLENELSAREKNLVEKHLASCEKCRKALEDRRRFQDAALSLSSWNVPADFTEKTLAKIFPDGKQKRGRLPTWAAAFSSLFLITAFTAVLRGQSFPAFLLSLFQSAWELLENISLTAAKLLKVTVNLGKVLRQFMEMIFQNAASLSGSIGTEIQIFTVILTLILLSIAGFLMRRKTLTGETE